MYSKKLQEYVDAHRPETVLWDEKTIRDLATKAGLETRPHVVLGRVEPGQMEVLKWGELTGQTIKKFVHAGFFHMAFTGEDQKLLDTGEPERAYLKVHFSVPLEIRWTENVAAETVTYKPWFGYGGDWNGWKGEGFEWLIQQLYGAAGLKAITMDLPEGAVTLPAPNWLRAYPAYSDPWEVPGWDTLTCFRSEVREHVEPFIQQLMALLGE